MPSETLYRYDIVRWSLGVDQFDEPIPGARIEVHCIEYPILKRTAKGAWIDVGSAGHRFVRQTARKQYACETPALAAESFRYRKASQIHVLAARPTPKRGNPETSP